MTHMAPEPELPDTTSPAEEEPPPETGDFPEEMGMVNEPELDE